MLSVDMNEGPKPEHEAVTRQVVRRIREHEKALKLFFLVPTTMIKRNPGYQKIKSHPDFRALDRYLKSDPDFRPYLVSELKREFGEQYAGKLLNVFT